MENNSQKLRTILRGFSSDSKQKNHRQKAKKWVWIHFISAHLLCALTIIGHTHLHQYYDSHLLRNMTLSVTWMTAVLGLLSSAAAVTFFLPPKDDKNGCLLYACTQSLLFTFWFLDVLGTFLVFCLLNVPLAMKNSHWWSDSTLTATKDRNVYWGVFVLMVVEQVVGAMLLVAVKRWRKQMLSFSSPRDV